MACIYATLIAIRGKKTPNKSYKHLLMPTAVEGIFQCIKCELLFACCECSPLWWKAAVDIRDLLETCKQHHLRITLRTRIETRTN